MTEFRNDRLKTAYSSKTVCVCGGGGWGGYIGLESQLPHAKFQDYHISGYGEEMFEVFLPYMCVAAILVMGHSYNLLGGST